MTVETLKSHIVNAAKLSFSCNNFGRGMRVETLKSILMVVAGAPPTPEPKFVLFFLFGYYAYAPPHSRSQIPMLKPFILIEGYRTIVVPFYISL